MQAVMREALGSTNVPTDPRAPILSYVERHRSELIEIASLDRPLTKAQFEATVGFWGPDHNGMEVLIPAARFQSEFAGHELLMRAVRNAGHARTEGGRKPKLTIKTPRTICADGRVYCVQLGL
ncbi:hypothetical protein FV222_04960 [Methylobacterium sp. WL103]|uniref:hypothetical protein n=1 Tax=Methylobacterium sp. WL103 TaxID=2603891 RepID=UPI0011D736C6|nr:hypothetical protein [Methylobacterium sp. WL103]TXN06624.1 hypothetical protein FV222_04960 [Methylobacterium sp. WL103]